MEVPNFTLNLIEYSGKDLLYPLRISTWELFPGTRYKLGSHQTSFYLNEDKSLLNFYSNYSLFGEYQFAFYIPLPGELSGKSSDYVLVENLEPFRFSKPKIMSKDKRPQKSLGKIIRSPLESILNVKNQIDLSKGLPVEFRRGDKVSYSTSKNKVVLEVM